MSVHQCDGYCATCTDEQPTTEPGRCAMCGGTEAQCECSPPIGDCIECGRTMYEGDGKVLVGDKPTPDCLCCWECWDSHDSRPHETYVYYFQRAYGRVA